MQAACGLLVSLSMQLLAFICKSSVCTKNRGPLCPLQSHFVLFFVSERSGGWKPPAEQSALYTKYTHIYIYVRNKATSAARPRNYLVETPVCKLRVMLRSRVLRVLNDLMGHYHLKVVSCACFCRRRAAEN